MAEGATAPEGARVRARRAPFPGWGWGWGWGRRCPTEARRGHLPQGWEPGQRRLQRERPEAGTGPESPGWWAQGDWRRGGTGGCRRGCSQGSQAPGAVLTLWGTPSEGWQTLRASPPLSLGRSWEPVVQICGPLSYGGRLCPKGHPGPHSLRRLGLRHRPQYSRFS